MEAVLQPLMKRVKEQVSGDVLMQVLMQPSRTECPKQICVLNPARRAVQVNALQRGRWLLRVQRGGAINGGDEQAQR